MVVLITGASSDIGASIALEFAKNGYDVVLNYNSNLEKVLDIEKEILKYGVKTLVIKCDVSSELEVESMVSQVHKKFDTIDCVVNNAAISNDTFFVDKKVEDFKKVLDVNLIGTFLVSKYVREYMNKGSIINVSSNNALNCYYPMSLDYDASKAGVISLTHNLALEFAPDIRVNAVCPGWINSGKSKELTPEFKEEENRKILLNRFGEAKEVAKVIYFLASSDASYINNSVIRIDGGIYGSN